MSPGQRRKLTAWLCVIVSSLALRPVAAASLDADRDRRIGATCLTPPPWPIHDPALGAEPIWDRPIPPILFQIWLGGTRSPYGGNLDAWRRHAAAHGLRYRLVTDADVPLLMAMSAPELRQAFDELYARRELRGASDLIRYLLLHRFGGIYIDADMRVPRFAGQEVPITDLLPMRGLVVVSDGQPVDWGTGGLHLLNGLMASCPSHPTLGALLEQLPRNMACCKQAGLRNPVFLTGPAPLNLLLTGPATVVPIIVLDALGVANDEWR